MKRKLINNFFGGSGRTILAKKNILASGLIRGGDTLIYLLLVPLTLDYLNSYEYGIWLTLNSILSWINFFDIGLGNGLRNKVAEALAVGDKKKARVYVSTSVGVLLLLVTGIFMIGMGLISLVDWYGVLNVDITKVSNLQEILLASFLFFCLNFLMKFIGNVYQALQLPAVNNLLLFLGHLLSVIIIFILTKTTEGNLMRVALVYSSANPIVYLIAYPITFKVFFRYLCPSFKCFDKTCIKELLSLSVRFFVIQICGMILFMCSNFIISHMFGPEHVTPYNIVYRYFSLIIIFTNIIITPMWTAATDAYSQGDINWIKRSNKKIQVLLMAIAFIMIAMVILSDTAYSLWVGDKVEFPKYMSLLMAVYSFIILFSTSYSFFLNGMGKLKVQTINTVIVTILFYPLCLLFKPYGVNGILLAMILVNTSGALLNFIQFNLVVNNKAKGIWAK